MPTAAKTAPAQPSVRPTSPALLHPAHDTIFNRGGQIAGAAMARGFRSTDRLSPVYPGEKPIGSFQVPTPHGVVTQHVYRTPDTSTGFDPGAHLGPQDLAEAAHLRRQNLGTTADVARKLLDAATGYTPLENAIHSGDAKKLAAGVAGASLNYFPFGKAADLFEHAAPEARAAMEAFHTFPEERTAANLRSKLNPANAERGLTGNPRVRQAGQHVLGGSITPQAWVKRVASVMPKQADQAKWAQWYTEVKPLFDRTFGHESDSILRGFAVSQANASPAGGLQAVLRVRSKVLRGQPISDKEISTVVKSIEAAVKGQPVEKGVAAKLSDFIDALLNKDTRTFMGDQAKGGAPAPIDIHGLRDLGYVDQKLVARLEARGLKEGKDFVVDNPGVATGPMYERAAEKYQQITNYLNKIKFHGRSDWKPAETQALGWAAIQKFHGASPEDLAFAIDRNTHHISLETMNGINDFNPATGDYVKDLASTQLQEPNVRRIVAEEHGFPPEVHYGPGGYESSITPSMQLHVIASPEDADRIAQRLANEYHQWEVWATRPGVTGAKSKFALELESTAFASKEGVERFWHELQSQLTTPKEKENLAGFAPYRHVDPESGKTVYGIRIITNHGSTKLGGEQAMKYVDRYAGKIQAAGERAGLPDLHVEHNNVEVRRHFGEVHEGQGPAGAASGEPATDHLAPEGAPADEGTGGLLGRLADERGSVDVGTLLGQRGPYEPRLIQHNDLVQQVPKARSQIANAGERLIDSASKALENVPHVHDVPGARILTVSERAAKYAGRAQRIESSRRQAQMVDHLHTIVHIKEGSPEDVANFWYSQLPSTHRNAAGLQLVHAEQAKELEYITSGRALEDLTKRETAVKAAMSEAETNGEAMRHLRDLEEIKLLKTDLPQRVTDITHSLADLEKLIANPPAENKAAIDAVRALSEDRTRILNESGRLNEERAAERTGLVSRFVGLEPTGEEAYIGHRLPKPESFRGSTMPSGGTGRVKSPQGVGSKNNLVLARTGRLRASLRVAAEDWQSSQVFEQANIARGDLGKMGTKFEGFVPQGHVLVNPKGRTVPAQWKTDELAQFADDYHDAEVTRQRAQEILDGFIAQDPQGFERMKQEALEQGVSWGELRVVPKRLLDRYYAQFRPSRSRSGLMKAYDSAIDSVATSIVFARLGYIPKNFAQNMIMAVPHQGAFLLVNAVRAAQVEADAELRHLIHAEIGFTGPTGGLSNEMFLHKVTGKLTGAVSKIADDPARIAAFLHEAAAEGVISRVKPLLGDGDRAALHDLLTNEAKRPLLNDIRSRSVEAMADFSRLTPDQARIARRFLIIPGWLMAGSRYPFHFAATHPIRSALLAYIALGEPGAPPQLQFNQNIGHYFKGTSYKQGIQIGDKRFRTNSMDPISTPWDLGLAVAGTIQGKKGEHDTTTPTIYDQAAPLLAAGVSIAQGGGVKKSLEKLAPDQSFVEGMIHPKPSGTYPDDATRLGRLEREIGVVPIHVNDQSTLKAQQSAQKWITDTEAAIGEKLPHEVIVARNTKVTYAGKEQEMMQKLGVQKLDSAQRAELKLEVLVATHPIYEQYVGEIRKAIKIDPAKANTWIEDKLEWPVLSRLSSAVKKLQAAKTHG